jgi:N-acetylglutamate synthase-like GNAT family acetyltransferase
MQLRPATPQDKPAIIELLKSSLGETMIPKSEALWKWKHEENPFGASFVLLAEEEGELIGVRAFMQWAWQWNSKKYKTIRAVDTATHPAHQGKGIFKKLTLKQLELCKDQGIHFVFNTPNDQSRPGYIKMGWQEQGRMPLKLQPMRPIITALNILSKKKGQLPEMKASDWDQVIQSFSGRQPLKLTGIHTAFSFEYLSWRYAVNPLFPYYFISDYKYYLLIYRPKEHNRYLEMRITDLYIFEENVSVQAEITKLIRQAARQMKADFVTISGNIYREYRAYLGNMGPIPVRSSGPTVTLRDLNVPDIFEQLMNTQNWSYSLGDMELF